MEGRLSAELSDALPEFDQIAEHEVRDRFAMADLTTAEENEMLDGSSQKQGGSGISHDCVISLTVAPSQQRTRILISARPHR